MFRIIVLIATITAPQVLRYLGGARTETAKAQMSALLTTLNSTHSITEVFLPDRLGYAGWSRRRKAMHVGRGRTSSGHPESFHPWGQPYRYRRIRHGGQPDIYSLGRDNAPGGTGEDQDVTN